MVTGTGHWYRLGEALVEGRWGSVDDRTGTHRDEDVLTTDVTMTPPQMGACDTPRWSIETTCQACRAYLKRESTKGDGQPTVRRFTPCAFGLYTIVVRRYLPLPSSSRAVRAIFWRGKSPVTCSEMLTCVRRVLWQPWGVHPRAQALECSNRSPSFQDTLLDALAPAAERAGDLMCQAGMFL